MKMSMLLAALVGASILAGETHALAQATYANQPVGQQNVCVATGQGTIAVALAGGGSIETPANANGTATLSSTGPIPGLLSSTGFEFVSITITGQDPIYGQYSFSLDASRPATQTVVTANQPGQDFPATANVYTNVRGTISGLAGTFTNSTEIHIQTTNLLTFAPQLNEQYTFVNDVQFTSENGDGTSFTIPAGATVTLR